MKTEYEKITFIRTGYINNKEVFGCYNKKLCDFVGQILWYEPSNAYCFFIDGKAIISAICLKELSEFITILNNQ